jgi:hypothetical protein
MAEFESQFGTLSERDRQMMESATSYIKAREKAESFLAGIDPDLEVDVRDSVVDPADKSKDKYTATVLRFSHKSNPFIHWTMEIDEDDAYINDKLETAVRNIYEKERSESGALLESWPWYETARQKAESFLPDIDPNLFVSVEKRRFIPSDGTESRDAVLLRFQHRTNAELNWTMSIDPNREYLDKKLEEGIRKIYRDRSNKLGSRRRL